MLSFCINIFQKNNPEGIFPTGREYFSLEIIFRLDGNIIAPVKYRHPGGNSLHPGLFKE
jgi:hypothetical protein